MADLEPGAARELDELRRRLAEAEDTLRAIRDGEVDALLVAGTAGEQLYTLQTADAPYRAFVEQMQEGAVTIDGEWRITYCNRRFAQFVNAGLEHVIGTPFGQWLADPEDDTRLVALMATGGGSIGAPMRSRTGEVREARLSLAGVRLGDDAPAGTLVVTDMSGIVRAQRENREKDEFLAMLAHELRNPLGAIGGAAHVLGTNALDDARAQRARAVIDRQVAHMSKLMDDLLDVGRVVTGKIALECAPVDLGACVRACVAAAAAVQQGDGRVALEAEPVWVNGDAVRLEQIVANLVSNALKFTAGDQVVRVSVEASDTEAVLTVADDGTGIDPELLPRVFDLFVQGDRSRDRAKGGLGIGLTLVRRLVELHGGSVTAASGGAGQGSVFTVRLPRVAAERRQERPPFADQRPSPARVMLVDDNTDSREMYRMMLEADGHVVDEATDGPSALEVFRRVRPEIVVLDIGLPGLSGDDVARTMRTEPWAHDVVLIALTGYGLPRDRARSWAAGFDAHLVKPVDPDVLRRHIALGRRASVR